MRAATKIDEVMPMQSVYVKTFPSAMTVKARINALDKHRWHKDESAEFDDKRRLLIGRDLTEIRVDDLLEGIPQDRIEELTAHLNESQKDCIMTHCRHIRNHVNLIHGPFGSGKTLLVTLLCEIQSTRQKGSKTYVACSSNSACDAVVAKFPPPEETDRMVVRAHPLSLERETVLREYHSKQRNGKLREVDPLPVDYMPPIRPQNKQPEIEDEDEGDALYADDNDDDATAAQYELDRGAQEPEEEAQLQDEFDGEIVSDEFMLRIDTDIMRLCEERYNARNKIFFPADPRMGCVDFAIHTWMPKLAGVVDSKWSTIPTKEAMEEGALDPWHELRSLYAKTAHQNLNEDEWSKLKEVMAELANAVLQASDVVISTAVQGQTGMLKGIVFEQVVMDEISVATHGELLCCWRVRRY